MEWMVRFESGAMKGPYSADAIVSAIVDGTLSKNALVQQVGTDHWQRLAEIPEIAPRIGERLQLPPDPPPAPSPARSVTLWPVVLLLALILAANCLLVLLVLDRGVPQQTVRDAVVDVLTHQRWEYQTVFYADGQTNPTINGAGAEGWDMVDIRRANDGHEPTPNWGFEVVYRRPLVERAPAR
jgi:hypothetical protein